MHTSTAASVFDIKAKNDILITNLAITLYTRSPTNVTIWTSDGPFWNDKNYEPVWTESGKAYGVRGSGNLDVSVVLPRDSLHAPIAMAAGETKGFYITIPFDDWDNLLAMDNLGTNLHGVWFENEDLSVSCPILYASIAGPLSDPCYLLCFTLGP